MTDGVRRAVDAEAEVRLIQLAPHTGKLPRSGTLARDGEGRVGVFMGVVGPYAMLRPVGGGQEWESDPGGVTPLTYAEALEVEATRWLSASKGGDPGRCAECARLEGEMRAAEATGDMSRVSDCVVLLRRHSDHDRPDSPTRNVSG
ncbi:hypothetical protein I3F58_20525 [Streptomyces sp. MUM 203J]|uniref:hypothetical protein n=1 Tax=Streptomyces sp. MUM 203J TaxID=2791990 RepID=UPI001F0401D3|nr:hypothetical protein [Streptomyces sp. MUM 203J]MCH0541911.1 hypothetical protein [Streptomyces sp. MUM 203J]